MAARLLLPVVADIEHEGRLLDQPQVHAVVVQNPRGMMRLARHVGLGQLGPEAGRLDQFDRRHVVGMGIDPVGGKQQPRPQLAKHAGQRAPGFERGLQAAVRQAQVVAPVEPEDLGGGGRFLPREFRGCRTASARRWSGRARRRESPRP